MKVIQLTDSHLTAGDAIAGRDPAVNLRAAFEHIAQHHPDADRVVMTGDLADRGEPAAYERLRALLDRFALAPRTRLLIGNHDDRSRFLDAFPGSPIDDEGFVQGFEDTPAGRLIYLDTVIEGTHAGSYDLVRQRWLERAIEGAEWAYLFMHHQPGEIGIAAKDAIGIAEQAAFRALLGRAAGQVRYIFHGHCHLTLSGTVAGVPVSGIRGTNHQSWPDFSGRFERIRSDLSPVYSVILIDEATGDVIVHTVDYLCAFDATMKTDLVA